MFGSVLGVFWVEVDHLFTQRAAGSVLEVCGCVCLGCCGVCLAVLWGCVGVCFQNSVLNKMKNKCSVQF